MNKFFLTIALLVQIGVAFTQDKNSNQKVIIIGTHGYYTADSSSNEIIPDTTSTLTAYETMNLHMEQVELIFLSACNTAEKYDSNALAKNYKGCFIGFEGCDETRESMSYFTSVFYSEYLINHNTQTAFDKALLDFRKKYPESAVTPVLKCQE